MKDHDGQRKLIGEPVMRPDGATITPWQNPNGNLEVDLTFANAWYDREDVKLLGEGDFDRGVNRIMQSCYKSPAEDLLAGRRRTLNDEIKQLKNTELS